MRYFLTLAYRGTAFSGWQRQPNGPSVQTALEMALATLLRHPVEVTGCGRTDAGVHARYYVAHFDSEAGFPSSFLTRLNSLLPPDIAVYDVCRVADDAHARFDAVERGYEYHISLRKDPFANDLAWFYPHWRRIDTDKMQKAAALLPSFGAFAPFCKSDSGLEHFQCALHSARWDFQPGSHRWIFHITANRFLRGMVRLIAGACIEAGLGKLQVADIRTALETQTPLPRSLSVPPQGLFLTRVVYPFDFQANPDYAHAGV